MADLIPMPRYGAVVELRWDCGHVVLLNAMTVVIDGYCPYGCGWRNVEWRNLPRD